MAAKLMLIGAGMNLVNCGVFALLGSPGWALFSLVCAGICLQDGWPKLTGRTE